MTTYIVPGLVEAHYAFPVGAGVVHITFTGGSVTPYGMTPARFATDDPVYRAVIENSDAFRRRIIRRL